MAYTYPLDKKTANIVVPKYLKSPISANRKLGSGSYGQVFEANNRNNVVKCVDRFIRDVQTCDRSHELTSITELAILKSCLINIPKLVSVEYDDKSIMLEMENRGLPLHVMSKKMTFEQRLAVLPWVAMQLLTSAYELQKCGIVHNDIKCGNVLMDNKYKVTLIDFGLCLFQTVDKTGKGLNIQQVYGTYTICPPEMFTEDKWVFDKLMPWSIGITLCEFLYESNNFMRSFMLSDDERARYDKYADNENFVCNIIANHFRKRMLKRQKCIDISNDGLVPSNIAHMISSLCAYDYKRRFTLAQALDLLLFAGYKKSLFCNHQHTLLNNKVEEPIYTFNTEIEHKKWRAECIEWLFDLFTLVNKMHLFVHAISLFDRYCSKFACRHTEFPVIIGACAYIVQYLSRTKKMKVMFISNQLCDLAKRLLGCKVQHTEVTRTVEFILTRLDDGFYRKTFDVILVDAGAAINPHKLVEVMINTIPPYDNTVLYDLYNSYESDAVQEFTHKSY